MILLTLIMYVFSVLFAQAVGDVLNGSPNDLGDHFAAAEVYFFGLDSTMLSLFMSIAGGGELGGGDSAPAGGQGMARALWKSPLVAVGADQRHAEATVSWAEFIGCLCFLHLCLKLP